MNKIDKLKERVVIIQECWMEMCRFCKKSAETGETTLHECPAHPLKVMHAKALDALSDFSASGSSSEETPKAVKDLTTHLPRPYLHMLSSAVTQYVENTEDVYDTNDPMPMALIAEMAAADILLDAVNLQIASAADSSAQDSSSV